MRCYLHQQVAELEQIRDAPLSTLHFPLLSPHHELGWHLAVQYQGVAINHNNNRVSRRNFSAYRQVQWVLIALLHCKIISLRGFHTNY